MNIRTTRSAVALATALLLAACGGGDDTTEAASSEESAATTVAETTTAPETTVPETTIPETTVPETTTEAPEAMEDEADTSVDATDDTADDETEADIEIAGDEAEAMLGFLMAAFGVEDPETVGPCIMERLESEGYTLDVEGEGGREMIALIGCEPSSLRGLYESTLIEEDIALDDTQVDCTIDALGTFISEIPLDDADAILDADLPPDTFMDSVVDDCGVSREDLETFLGG